MTMKKMYLVTQQSRIQNYTTCYQFFQIQALSIWICGWMARLKSLCHVSKTWWMRWKWDGCQYSDQKVENGQSCPCLNLMKNVDSSHLARFRVTQRLIIDHEDKRSVLVRPDKSRFSHVVIRRENTSDSWRRKSVDVFTEIFQPVITLASQCPTVVFRLFFPNSEAYNPFHLKQSDLETFFNLIALILCKIQYLHCASSQ